MVSGCRLINCIGLPSMCIVLSKCPVFDLRWQMAASHKINVACMRTAALAQNHSNQAQNIKQIVCAQHH